MDFTSFLFLFLFMPFSVIFFFSSDQRLRVSILLAVSLIFYLWGRPTSFEIIIGLVLMNYALGRLIEDWRSTPRAKVALIVGIVVNLMILVLFKLFSAYTPTVIVGTIKKLLPFFVERWLLGLVFPIGLSYITFQVISYLVDIYKGTCPSEKSFLQFCLYIFLFPKILTGPITLYRSIRNQLSNPSYDVNTMANGLRRFAIGLAKKVLIADQLARTVNAAFHLSTPNFSSGIAWLVLLGFAIQLYFDFSGYIDMALGLGQVLGFQLPENFNFPYISRSVGEFWRRWHMTLSAWFREYVFYPLERNRLPVWGQQVNILIVFLLTGLWHGLTLPFIVWGLIHGMAIALESTSFGRWLKTTWRPFQHFYALSVVMLSWIFFRSNNLQFAFLFLKRLFGDSRGITVLPFSATAPLPFLEPTFLMALAIGVILSMPVSSWLIKLREQAAMRYPKFSVPIQIISDTWILALLWASVAMIAAENFTPGIYDKF